MKIAVFFGGKSVEHEVSIESAKNILKNLVEMKEFEPFAIFVDKNGKWFLTEADLSKGVKTKEEVRYDFSTGKFIFNNKQIEIDVCFSLIHGSVGEDGKLAGFFETIDVAYTGCDVLSSAISMNKKLSKILAQRNGVNVLDDIFIKKEVFNIDEVRKKVLEIGFPVFVKPNTLGSSVGVSKVRDISELENAIRYAFEYDNEVMIEKGIDRAREIVVGIIGDGVNNKMSSVGEVCVGERHEFYDYEAKYIDDDGMELKIPAEIDEKIALRIKEDAVKVFQAILGYGFARVDFLMERGNNNFYFCEINTIPGFTSHSLFPRLFEHCGLNIKSQIKEIIAFAIERKKKKNKLKSSI